MTDSTNDAKRYNGWTNYETWLLKLWMDQEGSDYYDGLAKDTFELATAGSTFTQTEQATIDLADALKSQFEERWEEIAEQHQLGASFWGDIVNAALSDVNWHEIAEKYMEDVGE